MDEQSPALRPPHKRDKAPIIIHSISPSDHGYTYLLCQPERSISEYRRTTHPDLLVTPEGEMFSPKWTLNTCLQCDQQRLRRRMELIYDMVAEHLRTAERATCSQLWLALQRHPTAKYINLSRGILQLSLRELAGRPADDPRRLTYEDGPAPSTSPTNPAMAHWYKLP